MRDRRTIAIDGNTIAYVDEGDGPVALFVHGVFLNADLWAPAMGQLAPGRRAVAIDLPAHGGTPAVADMTLPALADLLERFCARLELGPVDLVANDTGGALAQVFAARHPQRLRTLTLTNCDASDNLPPELFRPIVELSEKGEFAPMAVEMAADLDFARSDAALGAGFEGPLDDETVLGFVGPCVGTIERARDLERFIASLSAADLMAVEADLRQMEAPTLIVWGTADVFFDRSWATWLRDTIAGASEIVEIDGAKLFFPYERAGELVPHLERHWAAAAD